MNLITVTYNADTHQLVPREAYDGAYSVFNGGRFEVQCVDTQRRFREDFKRRYARLIAEAPQPETLSPWLPIETAPKDGEQFYVTGYNYGVVGAEMWHDVAFRNNKGGITSATTHDFLQFAAYWMPKPPKPEQGK